MTVQTAPTIAATAAPAHPAQGAQPQNQPPAHTADPAAQGQAAGDPNAPSPSGMTPEAWMQAVERARADEKQKVYASLKKAEEAAAAAATARAVAEKAQADMAERVRALELASNDKLTPDQKLQAQIEDLQARIATGEQARQQEQAQLQAQLHAERMEAYRNRRLAEVGVGNLIPELVGGNTEEAIEQSIQIAHAEYQTMRQRHLAEFQAQYGTAPQGQGANNPPPSVIGTPSEHYTPPVPGGFPTGYAPQATPEAQPLDLQHTAALTSEEAVRTGQYAQHRAQLMDRLRGATPAGSTLHLGSDPRFMAQAQAGAPMPQQYAGAGVQQPQGYPSGPAIKPHIPTNAAVLSRHLPAPMSGAVPMAANPAAAEMAAAQAAIERTNAGANNYVQQQAHLVGSVPDGGGSRVVAGNADAARAAYQARFPNTPAVQAS